MKIDTLVQIALAEVGTREEGGNNCGKENHQEYATHKGMTLDEVGVYLRTEAGAMDSACWFWQKHGLNELADTGDVEAVTRRINGGTNGLEDRLALYEKYRAAVA